jgi:hypothetical protein
MANRDAPRYFSRNATMTSGDAVTVARMFTTPLNRNSTTPTTAHSASRG